MAMFGKQVPVDRVAEGLVDAHAVLVDRQTLRRTEHRRGLEAAIQDVGLERVIQVSLTLMLLRLEFRAPVRLAEPSRDRSEEDSTWTFPGILSISMLVPGMGVVPMMSTSGVGVAADEASPARTSVPRSQDAASNNAFSADPRRARLLSFL